MPVLLRVFPQGLDGRDPNRAARLREAYEDWLERGASVASVHRSWILHVLTDLLAYPPGLLVEGQAIPPGLEAHLPQQGETLRPDLVLRHGDPAAKAQLLITIYPPAQDLAKAVSGRTWNASPGTRMMELLHAANLPLGLVTNGEQWMLVYAPRGETTGFSSWYADLWMQEPLTLRAFHSLLHLRRLIGVAAPDTLAALLAESSKDQQEVTDQLGKQVRQAVEVLVQSFDRIDADSKRTLLSGIDEKDLYNAALTVMMRLVFLFSAEERGLLPLNDRFYEEDYSASSLRALLRARADQHGEEVLERRHDAWSRLLATFRAVHGGVRHDRLQLPAYGGSLFDPDRYPFLEGRTTGTEWRETTAKPLPINNRVVLHLLEALQELRVRVPGGGPAEKRRLSFRALDIEQIGHVYEGLLDHTARRATDVVLGLAGKNEPEIPLTKLEVLAKAGEEKLAEFLVEETGRSAKAISKALQSSEVDEFALQRACGNDAHLAQRLRPFAILLRDDSFGQSVIIPAGCVYVTSGSDRRSTGTHYTPRSLTEPIVQHTLEPLVYVGPAEGMSAADWKLKTPKEILALKVCDMAMGSGAFLVQACRYLAERLVEAWGAAERAHPGHVLITPDGELSEALPAERLIPADPAERLAIARRYVADRCLYGVDINPMAVEMAKLSLWLITLQRDRPFTFLDHALKCGDSLLGVSSVQQIENFSLHPGERQVTFATANLFRYVDEAFVKRRALEDLPSNDHTQIETKNRLHTEAEAATAKVKAIADCLIAFELRGLDGDAYEDQRTDEAEKVQLLMKRDADVSLKTHSPTINQLSAHARELLRGRRPFHWSVEFPEVFARGGFDAFVGNPPFMGGRKISTNLGVDYLNYLLNTRTRITGIADFVCHFFRRSFELLGERGCFGMIATNSIAEVDSRRGGLEAIVEDGGIIFRATPNQPWPGDAMVIVSVVHISRTAIQQRWLNEQLVEQILPSLNSGESTELTPFRLVQNLDLGHSGSKIMGDGFKLTSVERDELLRIEPSAATLVRALLGGADITDSPNHLPSRFVIDPGQMLEADVQKYPTVYRRLRDLVFPSRSIIKDEAKKRYWWRFAGSSSALYESIEGLRSCVVCSRVAKHVVFAVVPILNEIGAIVYDESVVVIAFDDLAHFGILQTTHHLLWVDKWGSKMGNAPRYTATEVLETFPFPRKCESVESISNNYLQFRGQLMIARQEGLTKTYNRFHNRGEQSADIARLRALHVEMDQAVAAAYDWSDLDLGHGFHATKQGERYTLSEPARRTVLDRLLALNHQRYAEQVKAGLHDKKGKKSAPTADGPIPIKRRGRPAKSTEPTEQRELF